jgi:glycosyltransferase involved in cell wall biosynthesis
VKKTPNWRIGAVVTARNEEQVISRCLASLRNQTVKLFLIVVNDGSSDRTGEIASKHADFLVNLPAHKENWAGRPELANVFNAGFDVLKERQVEYVLVSGADSLYPQNYVEEIVRRMKKQNIVLSSGTAEGETSHSSSPRGSGRIIDSEWFRSIGFKYPSNYGFEVYPIYKALSEGRRVAVFSDLGFKPVRRTRLSRSKSQLWGKGMKALNYWFLYAVGRAVVVGLRHPLSGSALLAGYLSHVCGQYEDIRDFVSNFQKRIFVNRVREVVGF